LKKGRREAEPIGPLGAGDLHALKIRLSDGLHGPHQTRPMLEREAQLLANKPSRRTCLFEISLSSVFGWGRG
jgi:hypothetical protein